MNDEQKLEYFDNLFSSGGKLIPGASINWVRQNPVTIRNLTVDDYFELLLRIAGTSKDNLTARQWNTFRKEMWNSIKWTPDLLRVGQVLRLYNRRFTGNQYVVTQIDPMGFNVHNRRLPQYRFNDLDYSSIDKILNFNF